LNEHIATTDDLKRQRILEGAAKVMLTYGFQRTTMDDIAKAAEMSRPALYLLFRNKTDIYQALAQGYFEAAISTARTVLAGSGPLEERLNGMLEASLFAMMEEFVRAPHGHEILDMKNQLAGELMTGWKDTMNGLVAEAIDRAAIENRVDLAVRGHTAVLLANLFWDAIEGMKARLKTIDEQRAAARSVVRVVASSVRPE
jgi:AcrR family transcriptional regulator